MVTSQSHARLRIPVEANGEPRDSVYPTLIKLPTEINVHLQSSFI